MSDEDKATQQDAEAAEQAPAEPAPEPDEGEVPAAPDTPAAGEDESIPFEAEVLPPIDRRARRLGGAALWLALLGLIGAGGLGAGGWLRHQQLIEMETQLRGELAAATARDGRLRRDLQTQGGQLEALGTNLDSLGADARRLELNVSQLGTRQEESEAAVSRLSKLIQGGREVWQIGEVEHLLLVANDRAQLQADVDGAIRALSIADERIAQLGDPRLLPVREEIARELNALRAMERIDIQALALNLGSLAEGVRRLPLQSAPEPEFRGRRDRRALPEDAKPWQRIYESVRAALAALVTVHREELDHEPLMAPDQRWFLYQNLRLQLEAARLAALRRDSANLRASLRSAETWLIRYFATDKPAVEAALQTVTELQDKTLNPQLPDLTGSLQRLRDVLASE